MSGQKYLEITISLIKMTISHVSHTLKKFQTLCHKTDINFEGAYNNISQPSDKLQSNPILWLRAVLHSLGDCIQTRKLKFRVCNLENKLPNLGVVKKSNVQYICGVDVHTVEELLLILHEKCII